MLPDFSEYNWVIPDFVWELSEQIDLGKFLIKYDLGISFASQGVCCSFEVRISIFFSFYRQTGQSSPRNGRNCQTSSRSR